MRSIALAVLRIVLQDSTGKMEVVVKTVRLDTSKWRTILVFLSNLESGYPLEAFQSHHKIKRFTCDCSLDLRVAENRFILVLFTQSLRC